MHKLQTVQLFRERLTELIKRSGLSQSRFAAQAELDRSTLSQLLAHDAVRLPRAETIVRIAARHSASVDWLLGLSQSDQVAADIVPQLIIEPGAGQPADEKLQGWLEEARGMKVRYVPASLPDHLKTEAVLSYETGRLAAAAESAFRESTRLRTVFARDMQSETEATSSKQSLDEFAKGHGVWADLPEEVRYEQMTAMADRLETSYPSYRWYLYDARRSFSVPFTVFGQIRAAIYMGDMYFVFTSTEHIRELIRNFDGLIRHAEIRAHECADYIRHLAGRLT